MGLFVFLISNWLTLTLGDASFYIHLHDSEIYMANPKTVSSCVSVTSTAFPYMYPVPGPVARVRTNTKSTMWHYVLDIHP